MHYSEDAFVTMLLTMALSANKEEYARPLNTQEMIHLEAQVRHSDLHSMGKLLNIDIGGLMLALDIGEEEAYRIYTLLNRSVQLSYSLESFMRQGIDVVTWYDDAYPRRVRQRLGEAAPRVFYRCGETTALSKPLIAIVGISGVKTSREIRLYVEKLVWEATKLGYGIITGGELGISRVALNTAVECGGMLVEVLGGDMTERILEDGISEMLACGHAAVLSLEHPQALFTVSHAIARNKLLFSMAEAAFIFNTDGKRGEIDALRNRYCDWIYAWADTPANQALISKGAMPFREQPPLDLSRMAASWHGTESEQMNMFDLI